MSTQEMIQRAADAYRAGDEYTGDCFTMWAQEKRMRETGQKQTNDDEWLLTVLALMALALVIVLIKFGGA